MFLLCTQQLNYLILKMCESHLDQPLLEVALGLLWQARTVSIGR
jgi:hypothetical protein